MNRVKENKAKEMPTLSVNAAVPKGNGVQETTDRT